MSDTHNPGETSQEPVPTPANTAGAPWLQGAPGAPPEAPQAPPPPPSPPKPQAKLTRAMRDSEEHVPDWYRQNTELVPRVNHLVKEEWRFMSAGAAGYIAVHADGEYHRAKTVAMLVDGIAEAETTRNSQGGSGTDVAALLNPGFDTATAEALGL